MNGKLKTIRKAAFSLIVLAFVFHNIRFEEVVQTWGRFSASSLLVIVPIYLADRFLMAWKWTFLLRPLSIGLSRLAAFRIYYTSSFLGFLIPLGIGPDVVRFFRTRKEGYPGATIIVSIVVERLLGVVGNILMLVLSILLLLWLAFKMDFVRDVAFVTALFAAASLGVVLLFFSEKSWDWFSRRKIADTWKGRVGYADVAANLGQLRNSKGALVLFTVVSFVEQLFPIAVTYAIAKAVHLPLTLAGCAACVPISTFLLRLPVSFMGLGVREGSYVILLNFLGIDAGRAVGLGMLVFAIEVLALLPAAALVLTDQFSLRKAIEREEKANAGEIVPVAAPEEPKLS